MVEEVLEDVREWNPDGKICRRPSTKRAPNFFFSQNSREPVTEPDEMVPLWKILHLAGVDWTYGSAAWGGENYCMFLADDENWEKIAPPRLRRPRPGMQSLPEYRVRPFDLFGLGGR